MASDNDLRPSKRLKVNEDDGDDDDLPLLLNNEKDSDDEARKRREKRRQRWKLQASESSTPQQPPLAVPEATTSSQQEQEQDQNDSVRNNMVTEEPVVSVVNEDDGFDMFSSSVSPPQEPSVKTTTATTTIKNDDFDDEEGYYKPVIGETILCSSSQYKVLGLVGKGVFSTVLKAKSTTTSHEDTQKIVALKLIRNNETMRKAAQLEMRILRKLQPHAHVVQLLFPTTDKEITEHHNHVVMCFDYMRYNLRDILQKFGRGVGLSLQSIQLYFPQLLSALRHFKSHGVLHADLKLDNMLVSEDFSTLQVCDFGSASLVDEGGMIPTPYLVSRYYRAPEIILGAVPSFEIDLWSVGVTVAELFLGTILFKGSSNNDMLESMMQVLGPFSPKQIKQHLLNTRMHPLPVHFENSFFLKQHVDKVSGQKLSKRVSLQDYPTRPLQSLLLKAKAASDSRIRVLQFADLLRKCLALDPYKRVDLKQAMHHEFFNKTSGK